MICYVCRVDRPECMFDVWSAECCLCASQTRSDRACRHQGQTAGSVRRTARDLLGADEHEAADALGVTVAQLRSLEEDTAAPDDAQIGAYACKLALRVRIARIARVIA